MRRDTFNMGRILLQQYSGGDLNIIEALKEHCRLHDGVKYSKWKWQFNLLSHPRWLYWYVQRLLFSSYITIPK